MPRDYRRERDALVERFYGQRPNTKNPEPQRLWSDSNTIGPQDGYGLPQPVNSPYMLFGHCIAWAYRLNQSGYGVIQVEDHRELAHRVSYRQTRGPIPEGKQINHLCDRPYCFQPSHLYAGTQQDNADDQGQFNTNSMSSVWQMANMADWPTQDPLVTRMRETERIDSTECWNPVEKNVAPTLKDFTCPRHDFSTRMPGGERKICRICGDTEDQFLQYLGGPSALIIARLWPISQASDEIANQFFKSGITSPQLSETTQALADRCFRISREETHPVRDCACHYCSTDRKEIEAATLPHLDDNLRRAIGLCEAMRVHILAAVARADQAAMGTAAQIHGLNEEQTQVLSDHARECQSERQEQTDEDQIEEAIGAATYCITNGAEMQESNGRQWLAKAAYLYHIIRATPEQSDTAETAARQARTIAQELTAA